MTEENGSLPSPLALSLDLELNTLASATRGAQILADLQAQHGLPDEELERAAPACITSMLALVIERIGQIRRVVRNEEDPAHLRAPHNSVEAPATSSDFPEDIILFSWNSPRLPVVAGKPHPQEEAPRAPKERKKRNQKEAPPESPNGPEEQAPKPPSSDSR
ncbi:hypothetical protein LZ198_42140 [Myxococcus sp. K15C18031901]|uniref:hypothetical protein n=1 Tax=Myxococcus dinghuensis TaxID=2906761 RepID=UPI0020A78D05|nr:hypothetical protein [Myxococcus dinghuensis]MCP3105482.1 hypothetical protein [Myxococcus dinghuensis]